MTRASAAKVESRPGRAMPALQRRREAKGPRARRPRPKPGFPHFRRWSPRCFSSRCLRSRFSICAASASARCRRPRTNSTCAPRRSRAASTRRWPPRPRSPPADVLRAVLAANPELRPGVAALADSSGLVIASEPALGLGKTTLTNLLGASEPLTILAERAGALRVETADGKDAVRRGAQLALDRGTGRVRRAGERIARALAPVGADDDPAARIRRPRLPGR